MPCTYFAAQANVLPNLPHVLQVLFAPETLMTVQHQDSHACSMAASWFHRDTHKCQSQLKGFHVVQGDSFDDPSVDSLMWVSPSCILICSNLGPEADQAQLAMLR